MSHDTAVPTPTEVLAAARAIVTRLRANAPESDRLRHLSPDSFQALQDAGVLQIFTPRRCGGIEGSIATVLAASAIIGEGCPGAAWHVMIANGNAWQVGRMDEAVQDEIFRDHPGAVVSGAIVPNGLARKVPGGWQVSGRFGFISAIQHASWLSFLTFAEEEAGQRGQLLAMYCPASDVKQLDNWDTLGMRSSGSPDVELTDVFVPDSRVSVPTDRNAVTDAAARQATNLFRMPVVCALPLLVAGPILGAAKRALELYVTRLRERTERYTERQKSESQAQLIRVAKVAAQITSAELLLQDAARRFDEIVARDGSPTLEERAAIKWQAVHASDILRRAVTTLYDAAGGGVIYLDNEFLSTFRNVHVATHHAVCDVDPAAEMFGRITVGLDVDARAV